MEKENSYITNFLKSNVQKSDASNIEAELKKDFVLAKTRSKAFKKKIRKKTYTLNRKERKSLGFFRIPRNAIYYDDLLPIHSVWIQYFSQILDIDKMVQNYLCKGWDTLTQSIYKADFHGSILHIVRSKCPSYVGKTGICIMDTRNTFKIVSKDNVVTTILKKICVFEIRIKDIRVTLFGKNLCIKPAERSTKKIKNHLHPDL